LHQINCAGGECEIAGNGERRAGRANRTRQKSAAGVYMNRTDSAGAGQRRSARHYSQARIGDRTCDIEYTGIDVGRAGINVIAGEHHSATAALR
jgi:hypothetical protein